jgi:hypothetical protein
MATTGAGFTVGMLGAADAHAGPYAADNDSTSFNAIGKSIVGGISDLPGLLTALAYMMGLLFSVLGILKIKDHVENPTQTQLKDGAIRLAVGGGLFLIPVITNAMQDLVSTGAGATEAAKVNKINFDTN